ncbi:hypothetical protein HZS_4064 [Henneguya salminicola]|nr:hypothetical protein HZS_4064 [Henneguya salminicola]
MRFAFIKFIKIDFLKNKVKIRNSLTAAKNQIKSSWSFDRNFCIIRVPELLAIQKLDKRNSKAKMINIKITIFNLCFGSLFFLLFNIY